MAVNMFYKNCSIPSSVRGADGEINLASFGSSGDTANRGRYATVFIKHINSH